MADVNFFFQPLDSFATINKLLARGLHKATEKQVKKIPLGRGNMYKANQENIARLQKILTDLECEFLYLRLEVEIEGDRAAPGFETGKGMLGLATACVAQAAAVMRDSAVIALLQSGPQYAVP